jgi:hypothetical protein
MRYVRPVRVSRRARRGVGLGASVALAAGLFGPAATAVSPTDVGPPIAVSGMLTDGQGAPVAGSVLLLLQPPPGAPGTTTTVPVTVSQQVGADGQYSLALDPTSPAVAQALADGNGWVTFTLVAQSQGLTLDTMLSRAYAPSVAGQFSPTDAGATARGWRIRGGAPKPLRLVLRPGAPGVARMTAAQVQAAASGGWAHPDEAYCSETVLASSSAPTVVGELHKWKDATASFTYGQTADSDIGAQSRESNGDWTVETAIHISNSRSASVSWGGGAANGNFGRQLTTNFQYEHQLWGGAYCAFEYVRSVSWNGGAAWGGDVSTWDGSCDTSPYGDVYKAGTSLDRSSSRAHNYRTGATVFGLGLTAQSGYSTFVKQHWSFGNAYTNHWMCGGNAHETTSSIVYAGPDS